MSYNIIVTTHACPLFACCNISWRMDNNNMCCSYSYSDTCKSMLGLFFHVVFDKRNVNNVIDQHHSSFLLTSITRLSLGVAQTYESIDPRHFQSLPSCKSSSVLLNTLRLHLGLRRSSALSAKQATNRELGVAVWTSRSNDLSSRAMGLWSTVHTLNSRGTQQPMEPR